MSLHKNWLRLSFDPPYPHSSRTPHLQDVLRISKDHEIKQHKNQFRLSPEKALIQTTNNLLKKKLPSNDLNLTISHFSDWLNDDQKRRAITSFKNRKQNKNNLIKKQLQLFSEINRSLQKHKIKRYQDQILLEETEIQASIAQHRIKRNWLTATAKDSKPRIKREYVKTPQNLTSEQDEHGEQKKRKESLQNDGDVFDRLSPSRRFSLARRRSKGKVSLWHDSSHFT